MQISAQKSQVFRSVTTMLPRLAPALSTLRPFNPPRPAFLSSPGPLRSPPSPSPYLTHHHGPRRACNADRRHRHGRRRRRHSGWRGAAAEEPGQRHRRRGHAAPGSWSKGEARKPEKQAISQEKQAQELDLRTASGAAHANLHWIGITRTTACRGRFIACSCRSNARSSSPLARLAESPLRTRLQTQQPFPPPSRHPRQDPATLSPFPHPFSSPSDA